MNIVVRDEEYGDIKEIFNLIKNSFEHAPHTSHAEQYIVEKLRDSNHLTISMVAVLEEKIVGHIAISPVSISSGAENWYGLGPISVAPEFQKQRIGTKLMMSSLNRLRDIGGKGCVVLGEPAFYNRFGFKPDSRLVLPGVPAEYFQTLCLMGEIPEGDVSYHDAFNA